MYLIDTNVISEHRKGPRAHPGVVKFFEATPNNALYLPAQVIGEIQAGIAKLRRQNKCCRTCRDLSAVAGSPVGQVRQSRVAVRLRSGIAVGCHVDQRTKRSPYHRQANRGDGHRQQPGAGHARQANSPCRRSRHRSAQSVRRHRRCSLNPTPFSTEMQSGRLLRYAAGAFLIKCRHLFTSLPRQL